MYTRTCTLLVHHTCAVWVRHLGRTPDRSVHRGAQVADCGAGGKQQAWARWVSNLCVRVGAGAR